MTVASTVCLHRFCATCIGTCLAGRPLQHKDCPVCRTNLHSRRSLRPEDALVAASNAAHAQEAAQELRQEQRGAQEAALAASRPQHLHRRLPECVRAAASTGLVSACPRAKRHHSLLEPQRHADDTAPPTPTNTCAASLTQMPGQAAVAPPRCTSKRLTSPGTVLAVSPPRQQQQRSTTPRRSCAAAPCGSGGPSGGRIAGACGGAAAAAAAASFGIDASGTGLRGPLAVPTARSAAELSFRHPGMVMVQLQPGGQGSSSASGRALRVLTPALDKSFLLCPTKWTVAHMAQLLSQWLPPRGYGPAAAPVPPTAIRLEPAPGLLHGSHRCLRGCTTLGALASELRTEPLRESSRSTRGDYPHLVR
uniref:RING-type E3 ubiquitin transferase n=1 Tax=Yamagishiella unicocca TaxID=51707 RepID=A0A2Z5X891_9CHLO|nr:RING finger containing protein [Yamagishiella unicocca]BBC28475.1 RING finger containing protein [Yamagishiella unicocca]